MNKLVKILTFLFVFACSIREGYSSQFSNPENILSKLLLSVTPLKGYLWPPVLMIKPDTTIEAGSNIYYKHEKDKFGYHITLTQGLINRFSGEDEELLSFIIAHELAHIVKLHICEESTMEGKITKNAITREEEYEADFEGMLIALDAGFEFKKIIKGLRKLSTDGSDLSPFDCLKGEHPGWSDRLSRLDSSHKKIWEAISSFKNGTTFLALNQYDPAIYCFNYVLEQFPDCYEANVNIGYAKLMKYLETLDEIDLQELTNGYFVTGNYYRNSASLKNKIRGVDSDLWWDAVGEFQTALRIKPDLTLAKSNLGLAYLVSPIKRGSIGKAAKYFSEALELVETDSTIGPAEKALIYMNAGLADMLSDVPQDSVSIYFNKSEEYSRQFAESYSFNNNYNTIEINNAIKFNKALLLMRSDNPERNKESLKLLEDFLKNISYKSPWWQCANSNYISICNKYNFIPEEERKLKTKSNGINKKVVGVEINAGKTISLSDKKNLFLSKVNASNIEEKTVIPGKNLKRIILNNSGIELLASEYIFAIILNKPISPKVVIQNKYKGNSH
ncbi:MAG: M48 family metalloprotease [Bacteroidetes bacterium]|nr:M48 family metalloprotease [Bacteroidota bacterium]